MKKIVFIIIFILIGLGLYGRYIEVNDITTREYTLNSEGVPENIKALKIVHFSDVLYNPRDTKLLDKLVTKINSANPDIVIFSGDLFNKNYNYSEEDYTKIKDILKKISASLYKFAVIGDNDAKFLEKYQDILYDASFELLDNESFLLFYKDMDPINIVGLTDTSKVQELLTNDITYNYSLAIIHEPDNLTTLSNYNINTILSGHSLGGIISIPYYGGILKKDGARKYINDYYQLNNTDIYISNGIGYEKINFRLFNKPSINIYRFAK